MTLSAKNIYDALLKEGALDSISLRKAARMTSAKESEWNRALEDLQMDFKILPVGIAEAGAWKYAFIYQITAFIIPTCLNRRASSANPSPEQIARVIFQIGGRRQLRDVNKLLGWGNELTARAVGQIGGKWEIKNGRAPQTKRGMAGIAGTVQMNIGGLHA